MGFLSDTVDRTIAAAASPDVWRAVAVATALALCLTGLGLVIDRILGVRASRSWLDRVGTSLAIGAVAIVSIWATIRSAGQSTFTPIAVALTILLLVAVVRRRTNLTSDPAAAGQARSSLPRLMAVGAVVAVLLAVLATSFTATIAVRAIPAGQPVDFLDTGYYSVLGQDLRSTGVETPFSPAGVPLEGTSVQAWYHWGELWLASLVIDILGITPIDARHLVALPVLLLATMFLTGTLVRDATRDRGRAAWVFGAVACLVLSPIPVLADPYFASYASGLWFGIGSYGLAAVLVVLGIDAMARDDRWRQDPIQAARLGIIAAAILPSHLVIAVLAAFCVGAAALAWLALVQPCRERWEDVARSVGRPIAAAGGLTAATFAWGALTGHGLGGSDASTLVQPFATNWSASLVGVLLGAGMLLAIPFAALAVHRREPGWAAWHVGTMATLVMGALVWGARFPDFNMFHVFFGGLATIATPVAAVATWQLWIRIRAAERGTLRLARPLVVSLAVIQLALAGLFTLAHLHRFGPFDYVPIPQAMLSTIRALPPDAKLAYRCQLDEQSVWLPRLISINAHTGRPVIPMCFQADLASKLIGAPTDTSVEHPSFHVAPQRTLYPTRDAEPSPDAVLDFLDRYGIDFVLADPLRPNTLVPDAPVILSDGGYTLYRVP